nr:MAG: hypothetical protein [Microviridae sp.]
MQHPRGRVVPNRKSQSVFRRTASRIHPANGLQVGSAARRGGTRF